VTPVIKELVLQLPAETLGSGPFTASIRNVDDPAIVWEGNVIVDDKRNAFLVVPNFSKDNDYVVTVLSNHEPIADFYFRLKISE